MKQVVERMPNAPTTSTKGVAPMVDLTANPAQVGSSTGSSIEEVAALKGQITKLKEMVEQLANDRGRKEGGPRTSRRRRRSRTRSRTRSRREARDVRDSSSEETRTPPRKPRQPSCPPPQRYDDDEKEDDKGWMVEKSWWQGYNEGSSSSDLSRVDARSLDPSKMSHEDLEW